MFRAHDENKSNRLDLVCEAFVYTAAILLIGSHQTFVIADYTLPRVQRDFTFVGWTMFALLAAYAVLVSIYVLFWSVRRTISSIKRFLLFRKELREIR